MPSAYEGTDIIMSVANNKVLPAGQVLISYCDEGAIYHTAQPYIISRKRYIIFSMDRFHLSKNADPSFSLCILHSSVFSIHYSLTIDRIF